MKSLFAVFVGLLLALGLFAPVALSHVGLNESLDDSAFQKENQDRSQQDYEDPIDRQIESRPYGEMDNSTSMSPGSASKESPGQKFPGGGICTDIGGYWC